MDQVEICNLALVRIGAPNTITAIGEGTVESNALQKVWESSQNEVLSDHPWSFATKIQELAAASADPDLDTWEYAYQVPNDCLVVRQLTNRDTKYEVVGDEIHANAEDDDAWVIYTKTISDPEDLPTKVASALGFKLAINIAVQILGDRKGPNLIKSLYDLYEKALDDAKAFDAKQENNPVDDNDSWITGRA